MTDSPCPGRDTLQQLLLGKLTGETAEQLEEHLLQCETYSQVAETVAVGDELTLALTALQSIEDDEEFLAQVIERGKNLRSEVETVQLIETVIAGQQPPPDDPLRPPLLISCHVFPEML